MNTGELHSAPACTDPQGRRSEGFVGHVLGCRVAGLTILLIVACAATFNGWRPGRVLIGGADLSHATATEYAASRLKAGQVPLWNPYDGMGAPIIGNGASAVFYPTMLLHMYLPSTWAWTISAALRLWLAGAGAYLLARRYRVGGAGSVLAGAAFMLCTFNVSQLNELSMNVMPLLPWAIVSVLWLMDRMTPLRMLTVSLVFTMQFLGGRPESSLALLLIVAAVWAVQVVLGEPGGEFELAGAAAVAATRVRHLWAGVGIVVCIVIGAAAAGVQWVPTLEYLRDWGANCFRELRQARGPSQYPLAKIPQIFFPQWFSRIGEGTEASIGTVPMLLGLIGACLCWRRKRALAWTLIAAGAVFALVYVQPMITRLLPRFPGLDVGTMPSLMSGISLAMAILAGVGLEELFGAKSSEGANASRNMTLVSAIVVLVSVGELVGFGIPWNRGTAKSDYLPTTGATAFLRDRLKADSRFRFVADDQVIAPALATGYRMSDLRGTGTMVPPRVEPWMNGANVIGGGATTRPVNVENPALKLLGVRYFVADSSTPITDAGWRRIYPSDSSFAGVPSIYENMAALPRAWLVSSASYRNLDWAQLSTPTFDPRTTMLVEYGAPELKVPDAPFLNLAQRPAGPRGSPQITWVEDSPERIRINVKGGSGGWLVLADPIAPGWGVRLGFTVPATERKPKHTIERDVLLVPAYGLLRAAPLIDPGSYGQRELEVIFEFSPRPWRRAWLTSAIGGAILLILAAWGLFPSKRIA